jgi:ABC-type sugar transport system ATPase subunit
MSESCCAWGRVAPTAPNCCDLDRSKRHRHKKEIRMYAKCVSGEEMKRGGKEQHSKIGPVNNGQDVTRNAVAGGRGDETGTIARCHGKRVRKSGKRAAQGCGISYTRRNRTTKGFMLKCFIKL